MKNTGGPSAIELTVIIAAFWLPVIVAFGIGVLVFIAQQQKEDSHIALSLLAGLFSFWILKVILKFLAMMLLVVPDAIHASRSRKKDQ